MLVTVHAQLMQQALSELVSPRALAVMVSCNLVQDKLRYQVGHDEYHFDNNAITKSLSYIEEQRLMVPPALERGEADAAWASFGRLTHTAQDLYSHTNYVQLWLASHAGPASAIDPLDADLLKSPELRSGRLYYPLEALYFIPALRKFSLSLLPADSHAHMNLDSARQGPGFDYAFQAALKRTRLELEKVKSLLSPKLFALFCDLPAGQD